MNIQREKMVQERAEQAASGLRSPIGRINGDISDLFFNLDFHGCKLPLDEKGQFAGWDEAAMTQQADWFLNCLDRLGIDTPTSEELIANFYARI